MDGGPTAFRRRVGSLRGYPLVVNQWASWCGPCKYEFPFFQRLARRYQGRIAFLYDRTGHVIYVHLGAYATEAKLDADIKHYAARG